jgi:DNA polymerase III subunit epsilon
MRYFAFDVETSGLNPATDEIVSLAFRLVDATTLDLIDAGQWFIHPSSEMDPQVAAINGYSREAWDAKGAVSRADFVRGLYELFAAHGFRADRPLALGYNVGFDLGFLSALIGRSRLDAALSYHSIDVLTTVAFVEHAHGRFERLRLVDSCARYGVALPNAHDAMGDITATVELYRVMRGFVLGRE